MITLPVLVKALAVMVVAGSLALPVAQLAWHSAGEDAIVSRDLPPPPIAQAAALPDTAALTALAPFGDAMPDEPTSAPAQDSLDLVLQGVILAADPARSAAFIMADGESERFLVNDTVAEGVVLAAVAADHVSLTVGGQDRILGFPNAPPPEANATEEDAVDPLERLSNAIVAGVVREKPEKKPPETMQDYIDLWRSRIRANPQQVLDAIGLVPGDGGYTIAPEHDTGLARVGLRAGDLVTRVNGQPVGDVDRDAELYDQIAESGLAQVEVERDGEVMTMSFPLR